jgi:hypothetical protein
MGFAPLRQEDETAMTDILLASAFFAIIGFLVGMAVGRSTCPAQGARRDWDRPRPHTPKPGPR